MSMVQLQALTEQTSFGEALLLPIEFWCLLQGEEFGIRVRCSWKFLLFGCSIS
jgi:hypothetical protein